MQGGQVISQCSKATVTVTSPLTLSSHHASARNKVEPLECAKQALLLVSSVPLLLQAVG